MHRYLPRTLLVVTTVVALSVVSGCDLLDELPGDEAVSSSLTTAIDALSMDKESRDGYDRDLFPHWSDADKDGCNARYEVLIAEAVEAPKVNDDCKLSGGEWFSYYDAATVDSHRDIQIDHMIPLAEAWDSGAHGWDEPRREAFANDLDDERALVAVTGGSNMSKSDRDPAEWLPEVESEHCRYITEWVAVKTRWTLSVDREERNALTAVAADCGEVDFTVEVVGETGAATGDDSAAGYRPFRQSARLSRRTA